MTVVVDDEYVAFLTALTKSADIGLREQAWAALVKAVGHHVAGEPFKYHHGWVLVGAPDVGSVVYHPEHGRGTIAGRTAKRTKVDFDSGAKHSFEHGAAPRGRKAADFTARAAHNQPTRPPGTPKPQTRRPRTPPRPAPLDPAVERITQRLGLRDKGDEELALSFVSIAAMPDRPGKNLALAALDAELARREGLSVLPPPATDPRARRVDELVAKGWSYVDAHADAHGLDPEKMAREERDALVDVHRQPGERREQTLRRMYAEHVHMEYRQAEDVTRGNLLSREGRAKGIDPASLWSGPAARARKYASDELKQWWEATGGRRTWAEFRSQYGTSSQRRAAREASLAGAGRDFGL